MCMLKNETVGPRLSMASLILIWLIHREVLYGMNALSKDVLINGNIHRNAFIMSISKIF